MNTMRQQGLEADVLRSVREGTSLVELLLGDGVAMRRAGAYWQGLCPFHEERSGSFSVGSRLPWRGHCFGCGWSGDVYDYWKATRGVDFGTAVRALASRLGIFVGDGPADVPPQRAKRLMNAGRVAEAAPAAVEMPGLPKLRGLSEDEMGELARLRGLSVEGIELAARGARVVGAAMWPQWEGRDAVWRLAEDASPSWVVTDASRRVAQFRKLDGGRYLKKDGGEIKCWTKGSPSWPVGAANLEGKAGVMLVEGGPDLLAAYHFIWGFGLQAQVAAVGMLGASARMAADALESFAGKRVRIFKHADRPKDAEDAGKRKIAGLGAASRWSAELASAGAVVEIFELGPVYDPASLAGFFRGDCGAADVVEMEAGFVRADGVPVKDLNDLALCGPEVLELEEVREAFLDWDF